MFQSLYTSVSFMWQNCENILDFYILFQSQLFVVIEMAKAINVDKEKIIKKINLVFICQIAVNIK